MEAELEELRWHDGIGMYTGLTVAKGVKAYHRKIVEACRKVNAEAGGGIVSPANNST